MPTWLPVLPAGRWSSLAYAPWTTTGSISRRPACPATGVPGEPRHVQGWLYSVSPIALRRRLRYLVENQREVTLVESPAFGPVAVLEVGATNVGSILQSFVPGRPVAKGDEKGLFAFGGSCVITLFARGRIRFDADLVAQSAYHLETYARMGESLGTAASA